MGKKNRETGLLSRSGNLALAAGGIIAGLLICRILIIPCKIGETSMSPSLNNRSIAFFLRFGTLHRGRVVLLKSPVEKGRIITRRIIALPGDGVEIRDRLILVNDAPLSDPWVPRSNDSRSLPMNLTGRDTMPYIKLNNDQVFVMGDNWEESFDSRGFGPVPRRLVKGTLFHVIR